MATKNRFHYLRNSDYDLSQLIELHKNIMKEKAEEEAKIMKEKEEEEAKTRRDWLELPHDVMSLIFIKLGPFNIVNQAQLVCSAWRDFSKEPHLFHSIPLSDKNYFNSCVTNELVTEVVDRSCGQLAEFLCDSNHWFTSDEHLHYVVDKSIALKRLRLNSEYFSEEVLTGVLRKAPFLEELGLSCSSWFEPVLMEAVGQLCPQLRCLRFSCHGNYLSTPHDEAFRNEVLIKLVRKLPFLEDLELYYNEFPEELIKEVGRSCTQMNCLRLNNKKQSYYSRNDEEAFAVADSIPQLQSYYSWMDHSSDVEAFAVADNIPQLRRLHLSCCKFTNIGLEAMLNRCTNLEYLDIVSKLSDSEGIEQMKKKCEESGITIRHTVIPDYLSDEENRKLDGCWSPIYGYTASWYQDYEDYCLYQEYLDSLDNSIFLPKKFNTCYL